MYIDIIAAQFHMHCLVNHSSLCIYSSLLNSKAYSTQPHVCQWSVLPVQHISEQLVSELYFLRCEAHGPTEL